MVGRATAIIWPLSRRGRIPSYNDPKQAPREVERGWRPGPRHPDAARFSPRPPWPFLPQCLPQGLGRPHPPAQGQPQRPLHRRREPAPPAAAACPWPRKLLYERPLRRHPAVPLPPAPCASEGSPSSTSRAAHSPTACTAGTAPLPPTSSSRPSSPAHPTKSAPGVAVAPGSGAVANFSGGLCSRADTSPAPAQRIPSPACPPRKPHQFALSSTTGPRAAVAPSRCRSCQYCSA